METRDTQEYRFMREVTAFFSGVIAGLLLSFTIYLLTTGGAR